MSSTVTKVVREFCATRPVLGTQEGAFDACLDATKELVRELGEAGFTAETVRFTEGTRQWPEAHAKWQGLVSRMLPTRSYAWVHYCVLVDDLVIDVTRRQFDPSADFPHFGTTEEISRDWGRAEVWDMDEGIAVRDVGDPQAPALR